MNNVDDDRLMRCFASACPNATPEEIRTAKFEDFSGWDSFRGVTLLAVLDEEFGVMIDLPELLELETFNAVKQFLMQRGLLSKVNE